MLQHARSAPFTLSTDDDAYWHAEGMQNAALVLCQLCTAVV